MIDCWLNTPIFSLSFSFFHYSNAFDRQNNICLHTGYNFKLVSQALACGYCRWFNNLICTDFVRHPHPTPIHTWEWDGWLSIVNLKLLFDNLKSVSLFLSSLLYYFVNICFDFYWQVPYPQNLFYSLQQLFEMVGCVTGVVNFSTRIICIRTKYLY